MVKINTGKFTQVKSQFASNLDGLSSGITKLTAMDGSVTPEQVSQVLSQEVLPAIEGVKNIIAQIDEALPSAEGEEGGMGGGLGEPSQEEPETGVLSAMDDNDFGDLDEGEDEDDLLTGSADAALQRKLQGLTASMATLMKENISMKKASLSKQYASQFPPHLRSAMEDQFLKENEDEDLEAMEAKLATANSVVTAYKTAGLIKKSNIPVGSGTFYTAKNDKTTSRGKGAVIPFYMR